MEISRAYNKAKWCVWYISLLLAYIGCGLCEYKSYLKLSSTTNQIIKSYSSSDYMIFDNFRWFIEEMYRYSSYQLIGAIILTSSIPRVLTPPLSHKYVKPTMAMISIICVIVGIRLAILYSTPPEQFHPVSFTIMTNNGHKYLGLSLLFGGLMKLYSFQTWSFLRKIK